MIDTPPAAWDQQGDPYWTANHSHSIRQYGKSDILRLLDTKVEAVEAALRQELQDQLFGRKPEKNPLRQAIADAYDETTFNNAMSATLDKRKQDITENIFTESPILAALRKEPMSNERSVAQEAVDKRKEKKAKAVVEVVGNFLDNEDWENGDTIAWKVNFHSNADKTYHYVAVKGGYHWYVTGTATQYTNDELLVKLTTLALEGRVVVDGWDDPL